jgi:beta-glucosidase
MLPDAASRADEASRKTAITPTSQPHDWWIERHEAMNRRVKQGNVDLIFVGDSITEDWTGIGKKVWEQYYAPRKAVNLGLGGDQTGHTLWRLGHGNLEGISPKLAVVLIGTNNADHDRSQTPEDVAAGIQAILAKLQATNPKIKILLLGIFPRGANGDDPLRQINIKTNAIISQFADQQQVFYLDIGDQFMSDNGTLNQELMPDRLHLNEAGYLTWAKAIDPMVSKLLGE